MGELSWLIMIIFGYQKKNHKQIVRTCASALRQGKVVAYPTDTSYGLAVDSTNFQAIRRLYKVKQRPFHQPIHIVVPSIAYAKKIVKWNKIADQLAKKFWPGPLTLVLPLTLPSPSGHPKNLKEILGETLTSRGEGKGREWKILSGGTNFIGLRMPENKIALDLVRYLKSPITTTSANPPNSLGGYDSYSVRDITEQFKKKKFKPDIIINAGRLIRRKPSTVVKITSPLKLRGGKGGVIEILRKGPISEKQIRKALSIKH
jgi:tRNA A37 threonylcarbamoyladenosine synthetase subunit TsaC/SUA5/YrdC